MTDLLTQIINFHPFNEQEQLDQQLILSVLKTNPLIFKRESHLAHITVSSWLVSPDFTQVLSPDGLSQNLPVLCLVRWSCRW